MRVVWTGGEASPELRGRGLWDGPVKVEELAGRGEWEVVARAAWAQALH